MGVYGFIASLAVVWSIFLGVTAYHKGRDSRSDEVASYQAAIKASEIVAKEAADRADKAAAREVIVYRDKIRVIREAAPPPQIIEVIKNETPVGCVAPGAFRVLHDSAASGSPIPEGAAGTDAAAVEIEAIARTIAENYRIANENAARLEALQAIINSQ